MLRLSQYLTFFLNFAKEFWHLRVKERAFHRTVTVWWMRFSFIVTRSWNLNKLSCFFVSSFILLTDVYKYIYNQSINQPINQSTTLVHNYCLDMQHHCSNSWNIRILFKLNIYVAAISPVIMSVSVTNVCILHVSGQHCNSTNCTMYLLWCLCNCVFLEDLFASFVKPKPEHKNISF